MADLSNDIRLAIDSGKTTIGFKSVMDSIRNSSAKLVVVASKNKDEILQDVTYTAKIAGIRAVVFKGNPAELGTVCGKPFSVATLSIMDAGNSNILNEEY